MSTFFNLPFGVRIAGAEPVDGDRYIAADLTARDNLIGSGRDFNGLQVFVESVGFLYILKDKDTSTWEVIGTSGGDGGEFLPLSGGTGGPYSFTGSTSATSLFVSTELKPTTDNNVDVGSPIRRFRNLHTLKAEIPEITSTTISVSSSIIPETDDTADIGTSTRRFRNLHTVNGVSVNFTASTKIQLGSREVTEHNIILTGDTMDGGIY